VKTHDRIRMANPDFGKQTVFGNAEKKVIDTTVGRVLFQRDLADGTRLPQQAVKKSDLGDLIWKVLQNRGS